MPGKSEKALLMLAHPRNEASLHKTRKVTTLRPGEGDEVCWPVRLDYLYYRVSGCYSPRVRSSRPWVASLPEQPSSVARWLV